MKTKLLSLLLALSLLIPVLSPLTAIAEEGMLSVEANIGETVSETADATGETATTSTEAVSEAKLLENCSILNYVDAETFRAAGHIARLPEVETLSSYAFRNADGTHTVYYFDQPVKYVDDDGNLQMIDLTLQADGDLYRLAANDLSLTLSKDYTKGITLSRGELCVTMVALPDTATTSLGLMTETTMVVPRVSGETLTYENAFGAEVDLRYTALYNGVKEDIILESYTGQSSFTFLLNTNGLPMFESNGQYYVAATADAKERITIGQVVAYDAEADMCEGTLTVASLKAGSIYQLTVSVDATWLADANTAYPVMIDPTLEAEPYSYDAIIDAPVYNGKPTQNFGSYTYNRVGYYGSWGIGRTAVRPDGMLNSDLYKSLDESQVNSVLFTVTEATGSANQTIQIHKLYNGEGWLENDVAWDSLGYSCGVVTTGELGNNAATTFDLTSLVKQWINGTNIASNGFMMKGVNETSVNKAFCSTEYGTTDMRPYMALNYTPVTAVITPDDDFVKIGESQQFTCTTSPYDAELTWMIRDTNIATVTEDGLVTGVAQGYTYLTAMWNGGSLSVPIKVGALEEGTYFIGNKGTGKYMDLESASTSDGAPIQQWAFHGQIQSRWIIAMESVDTYSIKSASSGKYIGVENSSTIGNAAIKQYSSIANQAGRRWNISITSGGAYRFTPCSSSSMALAVPLSGTFDDGTDLVQLVYTDNTNYRDEWVVVENGVTTFLAIPDTSPGHDHEASFTAVATSVNAMGYGENYTYTSATMQSCTAMIASSDIFYSRSHGVQDAIVFSSSAFTTRYFDDLDANIFSKCKLVLFGACLTGQGREGADNLVNATHAKGVTTVIGFETNVGCAEMNEWATAFFAALKERKTVKQACDAADSVIANMLDIYPKQTTVGHSYIAGSETQILHRDFLGGN
ncbi:MAG: RICIN domain-containing protein [Eubacteriales bacterium]